MGLIDFVEKIKSTVGKQIEKHQINSKKNEEIRIIKERCLSQLSHKELVQIYKAFLGE